MNNQVLTNLSYSPTIADEYTKQIQTIEGRDLEELERQLIGLTKLVCRLVGKRYVVVHKAVRSEP